MSSFPLLARYKPLPSIMLNPWRPSVEKNIGILRTIYVPPGLQELTPKRWGVGGMEMS